MVHHIILHEPIETKTETEQFLERLIAVSQDVSVADYLAHGDQIIEQVCGVAMACLYDAAQRTQRRGRRG